jgi:2,5-diketo-D-gluconate reductase B
MIHRNLRDTSVPALGFGTWQLTGKECTRSVETALEVGYRHIDTARMYENEAAVGEALANSGIARDDLFVTSKVWYEDLSSDAIQTECEASLEEIGLDYLDLYLIHWPNTDYPLEESLGALQELREDGMIKEFGVSNFPTSHLSQALAVTDQLFCDQVEYHALLGQEPLLKLACESEVLVTAYSPLAKGQLHQHPVLKAIGDVYGKSATQIALRWLVRQDNVAAIPRSSSEEHIQENFDIFDFELSQEEIAKINALPKDDRQIDPEWAPDWD